MILVKEVLIMKKSLRSIILVALCLSAAALTPLMAGKKSAKEAPAGNTLTGEVLDMACYAMKDLHGKDHAGCAATCIKEGGPVGLLTSDGSVYLLIGNHKSDGNQAMDDIKDMAAKNVKVTGKVAKKQGVNFVIVEKVELAK